MRKVLVLFGMAAVLLTGLLANPVVATPPADVEIVVPQFVGPFVATGAAVDDGVVCGSGNVVTTYTKFAGFQSGSGGNLAVGKEFSCDDKSGTFSAKLQVQIVFAKGVTFKWVITGGTGNYSALRGAGSGFIDFPNGDIYQGGLHID